jgi:hypothetical protein
MRKRIFTLGLPIGLIAAGCVCASWACGRREPDLKPQSEPLFLLQDTVSPIDSISRHLVARQQELFKHLALGQRSGLANLIDLTFAWGHGRRRITVDAAGLKKIYGRPTPAYFAMVSGTLRPARSDLPTRFVVRTQSDRRAFVTAYYSERGSPPVDTTWELKDGHWRVTHISEGYFAAAPAPQFLDSAPIGIQIR